jgi:type IV fimbrial biogenesis protein FimT
VLTLKHARGFTLIELLVTVVVMVVLAALAVPSMYQYIQNSKIHAAAEVLYSSVQQARTEAIRRNGTVELIFTGQPASPASVETTGLTMNGPNWLVRAVPADVTATHTFVEAKAGGEGGGKDGASTNVVLASTANSIQFNSLGNLVSTPTVPAVPVTVDVSATGGSCEPAGRLRCLRVTVATGGRARLCDPTLTAANDTRKC